MMKNSKNHDESPDKHYAFFKTSEGSGTKKQNPRQNPLRTRHFFQHLSNTFETFSSIRQNRLLKAHTDTVRAKATAKEKRLLNHFLQSTNLTS